MDLIGGLLIIFLILVFYFLPAVIASQRNAEHGSMIFAINLLFGWTILGWFAALIWAVSEKPKPDKAPEPHHRQWGDALPK